VPPAPAGEDGLEADNDERPDVEAAAVGETAEAAVADADPDAADPTVNRHEA
jgi:hypothetical protein